MILLAGNLHGAKMAQIKVDLEIRNFKEELKRVRREVTTLANYEIKDKIDYATDTLRLVTPVDTGEAREGWSSTKNTDRFGFTGGTLKNPVEHISYLNEGSSKQAPKYFIEQVLLTIGLLTPN